MPAQRKYPVELRERATRMAIDARKDPETRTGAYRRNGEQTGGTREALRAAETRKESGLALRLSELGHIGSEADVTRHCQLAASAQRESIDRRDDGLWTGLESAEHILPRTCACLRENWSLVG